MTKFLFAIVCIVFTIRAQPETGNTIRKNNFNFGHQSGYMYSQMGDAYFRDAGNWSFKTGFLAYYTPEMPEVKNPYWKKRLMLLIPLSFQIYPCNAIELELDLTDLFIEFPYENIHNTGGKSPRFRTKMRLLKERKFIPATALTLGVTFSSAKPYTIWDNNHNYQESNGLAGAGTGVADYLILLTFSKKIDSSFIITSRIGLAPLGSPVEYTRGAGQADEIPYGLSFYKDISSRWAAKVEISGMYNGLSSTELAHYSTCRLQVQYRTGKCISTLNVERGLTEETDTWVLGFYSTFLFSFAHRH